MAISRRLMMTASLGALVGCSRTASVPSGLESTRLASVSGQPATAVTLLRHGESIASAQGILSTVKPGLGLTERGRAEARRAAAVLAVRGYDAVVSSPLTRATETAAALAEVTGNEVVVLDGLAEISAGSYEGRSTSEYGTDFLAYVDAWTRGALDYRIPGGESGHEFMARLDASMAQILAAGRRNVLAVSHGEAIRAWASNRLLDPAAENVKLGYNGFLVLRAEPDGWQLTEASPDGP